MPADNKSQTQSIPMGPLDYAREAILSQIPEGLKPVAGDVYKSVTGMLGSIRDGVSALKKLGANITIDSRVSTEAEKDFSIVHLPDGRQIGEGPGYKGQPMLTDESDIIETTVTDEDDGREKPVDTEELRAQAIETYASSLEAFYRQDEKRYQVTGEASINLKDGHGNQVCNAFSNIEKICRAHAFDNWMEYTDTLGIPKEMSVADARKERIRFAKEHGFGKTCNAYTTTLEGEVSSPSSRISPSCEL